MLSIKKPLEIAELEEINNLLKFYIFSPVTLNVTGNKQCLSYNGIKLYIKYADTGEPTSAKMEIFLNI